MPAEMSSTSTPPSPTLGPILFAYDGSALAASAIEEAARHMAAGRQAIVACVWHAADVGFTPTSQRHFDADQALEVERAAKETAAHGVLLAEQAGFVARGVAVNASPTWKGILTAAEEHQASVIVLGSHQRHGVVEHLLGSVASALVTHSATSVLVVRHQTATPAKSTSTMS